MRLIIFLETQLDRVRGHNLSGAIAAIVVDINTIPELLRSITELSAAGASCIILSCNGMFLFCSNS